MQEGRNSGADVITYPWHKLNTKLGHGWVITSNRKQQYAIAYPFLNPSGAETRILWDSWVNVMATDALAPWISRSSPTMLLTMQDKRVLVFNKNFFQLPVPSQCWQITGKSDVKCWNTLSCLDQYMASNSRYTGGVCPTTSGDQSRACGYAGFHIHGNTHSEIYFCLNQAINPHIEQILTT